MNAPSAHVEPPQSVQWALLLAAPTICILVAFAALPRPQAVDQARASVDRTRFGFVADRAPKADRQANAELGNKIRLVGVSSPEQPLKHGQKFTLKTDWKVLKAMDRTWQMFVHIDLKGGRHRIHGDHYPTNNRYPTSMWQTDEVVSDVWKHRVPRDAPAGSYDIFIGFYIGDERMRFSGGDPTWHVGENRLKVGSLSVE